MKYKLCLMLLGLMLLNTITTSLENPRQKRQFSPYICGIYPYKFRSDYRKLKMLPNPTNQSILACQFYGICINGGFQTNIPCNSNAYCLETNPKTVCIQETCCTQPVVVGHTPTFLPQNDPKAFACSGIRFPENLIFIISAQLILIFVIANKI